MIVISKVPKGYATAKNQDGDLFAYDRELHDLKAIKKDEEITVYPIKENGNGYDLYQSKPIQVLKTELKDTIFFDVEFNIL